MRYVVLFLATLSYALGQQAVIQSVANAASGVSSPLAPQMLVSIYGANLAAQTAQANGLPLPPQLAGTTVTFNQVAAPLLYVSPTQINAQVPSGVLGSTEAHIVVTTASGASAAFVAGVSAGRALGVFAQDGSGCGQAAALNIHADGSMSVNTPLNSFDPQKDKGLAFFLTGMGAFEDRADGQPWQFNAADNVNGQISVSLGAIPGPAVNRLGGTSLAITYAGPAPALAGVEQVNALYFPGPYTIPPLDACRVPVALSGSGSTDRASQYVNVSIHSGGDACVDPPADSLGIATWQQRVTSDSSGKSSSSSVALQFLKAPGIAFAQPPVVSISSVNSYGFSPSPFQPTVCEASYPSTLNAGALTATGPGFGPVSLQPQNQSGLVSYEASLPGDTIQGGGYSINATGAGTVLGLFTAAATIPAPIKVTTNLEPGTVVGLPFTLNWTGGDSNSSVTVQMNITVPGQPNPYTIFATSLASAGTRTLLVPPPQAAFTLPPQADVEVIVTEQPANVPSQPFSAAGLTLGGQQTWSYVFEFRGLKSR